jgi:hypothetical protein
MNILNANITSGNIGADTRNEIAWRRQWVTRLQEAETFFTNYVRNPQYYLVYSTNIQKGKINWQNETISLSFEMKLDPELSWMDPINGVISAVKSGFLSTGKAQAWELDWPAKSAFGGATPFASKTNNYNVVAEILNDNGTSIGRQSVTVSSGYDINDGIITRLKYWYGTVSFPSVNADAITDILTIKITSIDGVTAENATRQKNISVIPETAMAYQKILTDRAVAARAAAEAKAKADHAVWEAARAAVEAVLAKAVAGTLKIGDRGPAGGFVFYDRGRYIDGWRYLEAAPVDLQRAVWGYWRNVPNTRTEIGSGKRNTELIVLVFTQNGETNTAAHLCRWYNMGGYNDWFLPSIDELDLIYKNLKQKGLGGFSDGIYWSSSQNNNSIPQVQRFSDGFQGTFTNYDKNDTASVRPVRAF